MNRFSTLLLVASCLTAVGQSEYCLEGTVWDDEMQGCVVANPADINFDGCVQLNDLLDLLGAYGIALLKSQLGNAVILSATKATTTPRFSSAISVGSQKTSGARITRTATGSLRV